MEIDKMENERIIENMIESLDKKKTQEKYRAKLKDEGYYKKYRKDNLEKLRESSRVAAKKRYDKGVGKEDVYRYMESMRRLRDNHKEEFNKILKELKSFEKNRKAK